MSFLIPVPLGARAYDVHIGTFAPGDVASRLAAAVGKPTGVAVLVDRHLVQASPRVAALVAALTERLPQVRQLDLPRGESCKTLSAVETTCQWLAERGYDRGAAIIGIGGGAACDHSGF